MSGRRWWPIEKGHLAHKLCIAQTESSLAWFVRRQWSSTRYTICIWLLCALIAVKNVRWTAARVLTRLRRFVFWVMRKSGHNGLVTMCVFYAYMCVEIHIAVCHICATQLSGESHRYSYFRFSNRPKSFWELKMGKATTFGSVANAFASYMNNYYLRSCVRVQCSCDLLFGYVPYDAVNNQSLSIVRRQMQSLIRTYYHNFKMF